VGGGGSVLTIICPAICAFALIVVFLALVAGVAEWMKAGRR